MPSMDLESTLMLPGCEAGKEKYDISPSIKRNAWQKLVNIKFGVSVGINVLLLAITVYISTLLLSLGSIQHPGSGLPEPYSPASSAVEYEYRTFVQNTTTYVGFPGEQWEQAMHKNLAGTLIRVSEDELELHDSKSVTLKDGGFAAGLGVAHNLHCVKKLKQWLYREHFYPDIQVGGTESTDIRDHADHCLDLLRQSVTCHADHLLYPLYWEPESSRLLHAFPAKQKCVNYDKLHSWMQSRAVNSDLMEGPP